MGTGTLGTISIDSARRGTLQAVSEQFHVWDLLGRSIVVHSPHNRSDHDIGFFNTYMCMAITMF